MAHAENGSGEITEVQMTEVQMTEVQMTEVEVSHDVYRSLFDAAPDAMVAFDHHGTIALWNLEAEKLFGYSAEEMFGTSVHTLVPQVGEFLARGDWGVCPPMAGMRKDRSAFQAEISLSRTDGTLDTGSPVQSVAAVRNVSERVEAITLREGLEAKVDRDRLESRIHQSQRYEDLGQLAGGVAHDLNNVLGAVINYAVFVKEEVQRASEGDFGSDWPQVLHDIEQIETNADRASELIHQLLAFARREVVDPQVANLNDIVRDVDHELHQTIGEHVELVVSLSPDLWNVEIDKAKFEQVLVDLSANARAAMKSGGRLSIDTENIVVDEDYAASSVDIRPGRHVRLRISDTGTGMDGETLQRAFEPFFTTKPTGEGYGLGLAAVYGIVTQAGGSVQIYSEPGLGTTISTLLPACAATVIRFQDQSSTRRDGGEGATVLVVEDSPSVREVTNRILVRNGYEVIQAANGPEALEFLEGFEGKIDLLLTDVIMPQMFGKELAERVLVMRPGINVVYMSGYAQPVLGNRQALPEGSVLVAKPFSEAMLLTKIKEVIGTA